MVVCLDDYNSAILQGNLQSRVYIEKAFQILNRTMIEVVKKLG